MAAMSRDRLRAMFANMATRKGTTPTGKRTTTRAQINLRTGAKRQNVTQKFLKHVGKHGKIAHPSRLVMGQKLYYLYTDYKTKTAGTGRDRWIIGKVTRFLSVGRGAPAVKVRWHKDAKLPTTFTHEDFQRYSIMQVGGRYTKKPANYRKGSTRKITGGLEPTAEGKGDIGRSGKFSYSTAEERRHKQAQAAAGLLFGHKETHGNPTLDARKKVLRLKGRAEYMRKYRAKKKQSA